MIQGKQKNFIRLKSNSRRTFQFAPSGWNFIPNRIGTGWSGVHPRYRKHGGEKGTALGGGVSLEQAAKDDLRRTNEGIAAELRAELALIFQEGEL